MAGTLYSLARGKDQHARSPRQVVSGMKKHQQPARHALVEFLNLFVALQPLGMIVFLSFSPSEVA
jgi:hypothetical protein